MTPSLMLAVMAAATSDPRSETRGKWIFTGAFPQDSGLLSTTHSAHSQFASAQRFYLWQGKREGLRLCTRRLETGLSQLGVKWGSRGSCENSGSWCCPSMTLDLRLKANTPHLIIWLPLCNYICGISRYEIWPGQARPRSIGARKHKMGRQISPSTDPSRAQILFWFRPVPLLHQLSSHDL